MPRRILALNPWHGGSHRAFLDGWIQHSQHEFTVLPLPAYKWKWRMRHAAVTFSQQLHELLTGDSGDRPEWDALFCTDMLGLAEFRGLCPEAVRQLPAVVYFHENQLTYPTQKDEERDFHFAYSNMTSALAADSVWFNSSFHRDEFLGALRDLLRRMPDFGHEDSVDAILARSSIQPPGIEIPATRRESDRVSARESGPLRIVWASRWEHDKNPELFFAALDELSQRDVPFELSVLGESFRSSPSCFDEARVRFSDSIRHWGFAKDRADYLRILSESDVVVSTASHEFFGISVLEALAAGCRPLVPRALAYPETLGADSDSFHDGTAPGIAAALARLSDALVTPMSTLGTAGDEVIEVDPNTPDISRYFWNRRSEELDFAFARLCVGR
jgi:glycosyltransferase involved in cell wall biosynthesis